MMKRIVVTIVITLMASSHLWAESTDENELSRYLFAYFEGKSTAATQEHLRFAISRDAVNWRALNNNEMVISSDTIAKSTGIRDPHILRGQNGEFLIVATDMNTVKNGWSENPGIVLLRSTNLTDWTHAYIDLPNAWPEFKDAYWVWAPQVIYDEEVGKYMIYFTLQRTGDNRSTLITYYAYANEDFTNFESSPQQLFSAKYGSIDNDIIKGPDGKWHLFYKGNTKDSSGTEVKNGIQQAVSDKLTGPYTEDYIYLDAYANTSTSVEGSSTFQLIDQQKYILMYDLYSAGRYEYQTSTDLMNWTTQPQSFTKDFYPRHGSVIPITLAEAKRLAERFPSSGLDSLLVDGWVEPEDTTGTQLVNYSFNQLSDDAQLYPATLKGSAKIVTLTDGNQVLSTGDTSGYLDLTAKMGRAVMKQLTGNYTISLDLCVGATNSLSKYCWAWAFGNGTNQYSGMVNAAGNGNWYYEIKNSSASQAKSGKGLSTGVWHTLTVTQRDNTCKIFIDGALCAYSTITLHPSAFASSMTQCWLGHSPFSADAYMTNTLMDNLRIYNKALTTEEVQALYAERPQTTQIKLTPEGQKEQARQELISALGVRYMHQGATLPTTCSLGTIDWQYSETNPGWVGLEGNKFTVMQRSDEAVVTGTLQGTIQVADSTLVLYDEPLQVTVAPDDKAVGYLYCHMPNLVPETGTGTLVSQTITYALGKEEDNGLVFNELNHGSAIIEGIGSKLPWCRDAFLAKDPQRHCYYIVTTDLYGSQDSGTSMLGNYSIGMFRSNDLIHWSYTRCDLKQYLKANPTTIKNDAGTAKLTYTKVSRVWAPQIILIGGDPYIYYAVGNSDNGDNDHFYISKANEDFTGIESFQLLYGPNRNGNILDADINYLPTDGLYHMYYRDYAAGDLRDITCQDLLNPEWSTSAVSSFTDGSGFEAPSVFRRINQDVWNVGNVNYSSNLGFHFHRADALLRNLQSESGMSGHLAAQHGSFVMLDQDEWNVVQRWSDLRSVVTDATWLLQHVEQTELALALTEAQTLLAEDGGADTDMHALAQRLEDCFTELSTLYHSARDAYYNEEHLAELEDKGKAVTVTNGTMTSNAGWTVTGSGSLTVNSGVGEFFASRYVNYSVTMSRTVSGLENGMYVASVQCFERNGDNDHYGRDCAEGVEKINYEFFAGDESMPVKSVYSVPYTGTGNLYGFSNTMSTSNTLFSADKENFRCRLYVRVTDGTLTLGLRRPQGTVSSTCDWCCFDNFRLALVDDETGVDAIPCQQQGAVYNLNGQRIFQMQPHHVYIQNRLKYLAR